MNWVIGRIDKSSPSGITYHKVGGTWTTAKKDARRYPTKRATEEAIELYGGTTPGGYLLWMALSF